MEKVKTKCCPVCNTDISNTHPNRKFCSNKCSEKNRYLKNGQRVTKDKRKIYYGKRVSVEGYRDKLRKQAINRYNQVQSFLRDYKVSKGCKDCGFNLHHAALDFDHVTTNKSFNVCNSKSINQAKKEIEKCEVVCSNCHRIRTFNRLQNKKVEE